MKITVKECCSEAYHAEKDGKEFQVGLRFEDGTATYPKKCTVIIDGEEETVDIGEGDDRIKKAVKAGAEKLGYKIVESAGKKKNESYDGDPTVAEVKQYLQRTLDELDGYEDNATVIMSPNTYGISNYFIALGSHGYMPMEGFDVDRDSEDEEDEAKKDSTSEEKMSYAELKADALKRIGEGPFTDEDDLEDSIMSTLDAMPYDIPEGIKQSLGSDIFEILYDKIEEA